MSNAEIFYLAVVVFIGLPASLKNWTATALVLCYVFMQGSYYGLGIFYPTPVSVLADITVIILILAKHPVCDLHPYENWKAWLVSCLWLERSRWDRIVLGLFPVGWAFYAFADDSYWPLYLISLAQLLAAAFEALEAHRSTRMTKRTPAQDSHSGFEFTGWGLAGYE